jgi:hypothetical protein
MGATAIRRRLSSSASACFASDAEEVAEAERWLSGLSAQELLRVDAQARQWWDGNGTLGKAQQWTGEVLTGSGPTTAVLASMHADGHVRERGVRALTTWESPLADAALAVRLADHVPIVRETAAGAVLGRTSLDSAASIMPVLERIAVRGRTGDVRDLYLHGLMESCGEGAVWQRLRASSDLRVRRAAYRHSFAIGLLGLEDAVAAVDHHLDQMVRRMAIHIVADHGTPDVVAATLLRCGSAEGRVLGLVRLGADELDPTVVESLLIDRSVLVRLWARQRWTEMGRDVVSTYSTLARAPEKARAAARAWAYTGLLEAGGDVTRDEALELIRAEQPALVRVGLRRLGANAELDDVVTLMDVVRSGTNKEARLASDALVRLRRGWGAEDIEDMKAGNAVLRRRRWWLQRSLGGWSQVIADLEILGDDDPYLARVGRDVVAPMYSRPSEAERRVLEELIATAPIGQNRRLHLAFAAGLREGAAQEAVASDEEVRTETVERKWWRDLFRRG